MSNFTSKELLKIRCIAVYVVILFAFCGVALPLLLCLSFSLLPIMKCWRIVLLVALCLGYGAVAKAQQRVSNLEMGKYELARGRYTNCIDYLNQELMRKPDSYYAYYFRGIAKGALEDYLGAEQDYTKAIQIYAKRADVFTERAVVRDRQLNYKGAFEDYQRAINLDSMDATIYFDRAVTLLAVNQFEAAIDDCNRAERLHYKNENLYVIRGAAKAGLTSYQTAITDFDKVISRYPKNTFALIQRGIAFSELSKKDSAMHDFNTVLKIDSVNIDALFNRSMIYMDQTKTEQAINDLNNIIRISPGYASAYFNRAIIYGNSKKYKQSLQDYDKVIELNPKNILAYFNRAIVRSDNKDLKGALSDYDRVIELFPEFADAYYNRSLVKKDLNNVKGSTEDYKKALRIKQQNYSLNDSVKFTKGVQLMKLMTQNIPNDKNLDESEKKQNTLANIQLQPVFSITLMPVQKNFKIYKQGDKQHTTNSVISLVNNKDTIDVNKVKEQITQLGIAINNRPDDASNYLDRAILYSSIKSYNESFADYDKAIQLNPTNPMAWFSRANTRFKLLELIHTFDEPALPENAMDKTKKKEEHSDHTYDMVISDYNKTLALDPSFTYAWFNNANTKTLIGDYKGAVNDLTKAIKLEPTLSDAYFNRGLLLIFMNETELACKDISKAGELGISEAYNVIKRYCYK